MLLPFLSHFSPLLFPLGLLAVLIYSAFLWLCTLPISWSFSSFFLNLFFVFHLSFSLTCFIFLSFFQPSFLFHFFSPFFISFSVLCHEYSSDPFLTFVIYLYLQNASCILQFFSSFSHTKYIHNFLPIFWHPILKNILFFLLYLLGSNSKRYSPFFHPISFLFLIIFFGIQPFCWSGLICLLFFGIGSQKIVWTDGNLNQVGWFEPMGIQTRWGGSNSIFFFFHRSLCNYFIVVYLFFERVSF